MIIGAIRLAGEKWKWTHGSNYAARNRMRTWHPTSDGVKAGELVYKCYEPGASGYDLPSTYDKDPDRNDYYHAGVVLSAKPLDIVHCTSVQGGIKHDNTIGKWKYAGELNLVDYTNGGEQPMQKAIVVAQSGSTVRIRSGMSTNDAVVGEAKVGNSIDVITYGDDWCYVDYNGLTGYMMSKFIDLNGGEHHDGSVTIDRAIAEQLYEALRVALGK